MTGLPPRCLLLSISRTLPGRRRPRAAAGAGDGCATGCPCGAAGGHHEGDAPQGEAQQGPDTPGAPFLGQQPCGPVPSPVPAGAGCLPGSPPLLGRPLHLPCFPPGHDCWVNCTEEGSCCTNSIATHGCCCLGARRMSVQLGKGEVAFRIPWSGSVG